MDTKDYPIGIVRGVLLAIKADPIVLHAFDCIVDGVRSRAGAVIGEHRAIENDPAAPHRPIKVESSILPAISLPLVKEHPPEQAPAKKAFFWTRAEDDVLQTMVAAGRKPKEIQKALPERSKQSIYMRISNLKLKAKS